MLEAMVTTTEENEVALLLITILILFCFDIAKFPFEVLITSKALTLL